jgi:putative membrane protein
MAGASAATAASPVDVTFVGKVSQGGMFEVEAGQLAERKAVAQDVKDFAVMEVHDHTLVNDKLKAICARQGIPVAARLNPMFQQKLDRLRGVSGPAFDVAYMVAMSDIHAKDGATFGQEATAGATPDFRAFAAESHKIVQRHIGAIHATTPPPMS